jgi:hypothetical protein
MSLAKLRFGRKIKVFKARKEVGRVEISTSRSVMILHTIADVFSINLEGSDSLNCTSQFQS